MKGDTSGNLMLDNGVTRYQAALFFVQAITGETAVEKWNEDKQSAVFGDVPEYGTAIDYANGIGLIKGRGDGTYGYNDPITYQDMLVLAVRALGYETEGMTYPHGYIVAAKKLGLTDNLATGIANTQALTRGETAQVIYNALFAETKNGSTLGLESFGIEFAWENVIITASDRDMFTNVGTAASSFVKFQLVEDGELSEEVYAAKAADFGLTGHEDELAVGASYKVFFEKDADSELAKIIDYKTNYVGSAWNFGNDIDPEIEALFDTEYKLVSKYSANYLGNKFADASDPRNHV
jgi:hypothetical protein